VGIGIKNEVVLSLMKRENNKGPKMKQLAEHLERQEGIKRLKIYCDVVVL
jgi:hypothetical protein